MDTKKIITYNIITLIAIFNTLYIYLYTGINEISLTKEYFYTILPLITTLILIISSNILINSSQSVKRALYKKNILRSNLALVSVLTITSIIRRIMEISTNNLNFANFLQTILYLLMLTITYKILKDLFKIINTHFKKKI